MNLKISLYLVLFFLCGIAIGVYVGQKTASHDLQTVEWRRVVEGDLDKFYTDVLKITKSQGADLLQIEKGYQDRRDYYAGRMHKANLTLADVIEKEGYESSRIEPLVMEIHTAMGELQALSLSHLADIEKVLQPAQAALLKKSAVARLRQN